MEFKVDAIRFARRYYAPYFDCSAYAGFPSIFGQPSHTLEQSFWSIRSNLFLALNKWFWRTLAPRRESRSFHVCVDGLLIKSHLVISVRPWSFGNMWGSNPAWQLLIPLLIGTLSEKEFDEMEIIIRCQCPTFFALSICFTGKITFTVGEMGV